MTEIIVTDKGAAELIKMARDCSAYTDEDWEADRAAIEAEFVAEVVETANRRAGSCQDMNQYCFFKAEDMPELLGMGLPEEYVEPTKARAALAACEGELKEANRYLDLGALMPTDAMLDHAYEVAEEAGLTREEMRKRFSQYFKPEGKIDPCEHPEV
ncbi:MAG: hypothetical protein ISS36_00605 [Candidatus Aenigmarchaeota archaeon]|nr:hypothetical protein [Candidatus Aenigmarchaeota archaeon]